MELHNAICCGGWSEIARPVKRKRRGDLTGFKTKRFHSSSIQPNDAGDMSIDLDWSVLDAELSARCLASINAALSTTNKPAFLGDISATSFSLGSIAPELELLEVRDVYEEFLHIDDEVDGYGAGVKTHDAHLGAEYDDYVHVEREPGWQTPGGSVAMARMGSEQVHHQRRRRQSSVGAVPNNSTSAAGDFPFPRLVPHLDADQRSNASAPPNLGRRQPPSVSTPGLRGNLTKEHSQSHRSQSPLDRRVSVATDGQALPPSPSDVSLQMHFLVRYSGDMTVGIQTSIRVSYPTLSFMSLPFSMTLTSLAFEGIVVVAYEGDRQRLHISILDTDSHKEGARHHPGVHDLRATTGAKLLKNIKVESEVGQIDKLVLRDVRRVEQFVIGIAHKALQVRTMLSNDMRI